MALSKADEDTAVSLCRMTYQGDCRCKKDGRVVCEPMIRHVEGMSEHLVKMRAAFGGRYPENEATCDRGFVQEVGTRHSALFVADQ